jgi:hypothetical protein
MMILPLLCAAYAEVNGEGKRLLKVTHFVYLSNLRSISSSLSCNYISVYLSDGAEITCSLRHVAVSTANDYFRYNLSLI